MRTESASGTADSVDPAAPVLSQIVHLGSAYHDWVHRPLPSGSSVRLFRASWLERLSRTPWWVVPLLWVPVAAWLFGLASLALGPWPALGRVVLGLGAWACLEYALHRFGFHHRARTAAGRRLHFVLHGIHHVTPDDPDRLVFPPILAALVAGALFLCLRAALPFDHAVPVMAGLVLGYTTYDVTHYYLHHGHPRTRFGRQLKRNHFRHHFRTPDRLFGVTQPLFDLMMRTADPVPRRHPQGRDAS